MTTATIERTEFATTNFRAKHAHARDYSIRMCFEVQVRVPEDDQFICLVSEAVACLKAVGERYFAHENTHPERPLEVKVNQLFLQDDGGVHADLHVKIHYAKPSELPKGEGKTNQASMLAASISVAMDEIVTTIGETEKATLAEVEHISQELVNLGSDFITPPRGGHIYEDLSPMAAIFAPSMGRNSDTRKLELRYDFRGTAAVATSIELEARISYTESEVVFGMRKSFKPFAQGFIDYHLSMSSLSQASLDELAAHAARRAEYVALLREVVAQLKRLSKLSHSFGGFETLTGLLRYHVSMQIALATE